MARWRHEAWVLQLGMEWQHFSSDFYKLIVQHQTWEDNLSTFIHFITTKWHIKLPSYIIFTTLSFPFKSFHVNFLVTIIWQDHYQIRWYFFRKTAIIMCLCAHNTKQRKVGSWSNRHMSPERKFDTEMRRGDDENVFIARKRFSC